MHTYFMGFFYINSSSSDDHRASPITRFFRHLLYTHVFHIEISFVMEGKTPQYNIYFSYASVLKPIISSEISNRQRFRALNASRHRH